MSRINWRQLRKNIPHRIQLTSKVFYEVLFTSDFKDGNTLGETRFNPNQIVIKNGQTDKMTVLVYLHELAHSVSNEYDAKLTENQVLAIEKSLIYVLKNGNIFTYEDKNKKAKSRK